MSGCPSTLALFKLFRLSRGRLIWPSARRRGNLWTFDTCDCLRMSRIRVRVRVRVSRWRPTVKRCGLPAWGDGGIGSDHRLTWPTGGAAHTAPHSCADCGWAVRNFRLRRRDSETEFQAKSNSYLTFDHCSSMAPALNYGHCREPHGPALTCLHCPRSPVADVADSPILSARRMSNEILTYLYVHLLGIFV